MTTCTEYFGLHEMHAASFNGNQDIEDLKEKCTLHKTMTF